MGFQHRLPLEAVEQTEESLSVKVIGGHTSQLLVSRIIIPSPIYKHGDIDVSMSSGDIKGVFLIVEVAHQGRALRDIARLAREKFKGRLIGVTGSVAKTITKDMISLVLSYCGATRFF